MFFVLLCSIFFLFFFFSCFFFRYVLICFDLIFYNLSLIVKLVNFFADGGRLTTTGDERSLRDSLNSVGI